MIKVILNITDKGSSESLACVSQIKKFLSVLAAKERQNRVCARMVTSGFHMDFREIMFNFYKSILTNNSSYMEIFKYMTAISTDNSWVTSCLKSAWMAALVTSGSKGATEWNKAEKNKTKKDDVRGRHRFFHAYSVAIPVFGCWEFYRGILLGNTILSIQMILGILAISFMINSRWKQETCLFNNLFMLLCRKYKRERWPAERDIRFPWWTTFALQRLVIDSFMYC